VLQGRCTRTWLGDTGLITPHVSVDESGLVTTTQDVVCINYGEKTHAMPTQSGDMCLGFCFTQMAAVPPPVVPPVAAVGAAGAAPPIAPDVQAALAVCGVTAAATRTRIIDNEGFASLEDLSVLENDKDVDEMAKRLAARTLADGRVNLGMVQIKRIQALAWWTHDQIKHGQALVAADFDVAALNSAMERKRVEKERESGDVAVEDLAKFDPDDFDVHEDAFPGLLAQTCGVMGEPIHCVVRPQVAPDHFVDAAEERMFQLPMHGPSFEDDNRTVFRKLKSFLIDAPGWAWIERFDATENGRGAFWAWADHCNGQGELSKRTALAKSRIKNLHCKNERSMSFEKCAEHLMKAFAALDKDEDESCSDRQKVEKLLQGVMTSDTELMGSKAVIAQTCPRDFAGACAYFSQQVSRLHGGAQLENQRSRRRQISEAHSDRGRGRGRGRGRARLGGRGGGRFGRGTGRGGRGDRTTVINGVDVSDPTRQFNEQEWAALEHNGGRAHVVQARERMSHSGRGRGRGDGGRGCGRGHQQRNASAVNTEQQAAPQDVQSQAGSNNQNNQGRGERGGRNGCGFGRNACRG